MIIVSNEGMQMIADGSIFPDHGRRNYYDFVRTASFVPFITAFVAAALRSRGYAGQTQVVVGVIIFNGMTGYLAWRWHDMRQSTWTRQGRTPARRR